MRIFTIAFVVGIFLLSALMPVTWLGGMPLCHIKALWGFDCPGCGLTRAFFYIFHGNFRQGIQMNALAPVLILWFTIYLMEDLIILIRGMRPKWHTAHGNQWIGRLFLILLVGQWVWKLIPFS